MNRNNIKAIIFDSGGVLNYPVTTHWFITPDFFKYVNKNKFDNIDKWKISLAFSASNKYIQEQKFILTKDDEYKHFFKFYQIFSDCLPELELADCDIKSIAKDLVYNPEKYQFYDDAVSSIRTLYSKYDLAVLSDAWPSLIDVYDKNNLTKYFKSIIISSFVGTTKPNKLMYSTALNELNIKPNEAIFIDDNLNNCKGAINSGIRAFYLCRNKKVYIIEKVKSIGKKYTVINTLNQLNNIL